MTRRVWIWIGVAAGSVALLALALFLFVNTQPGRNSIASLISPMTQGRVSVTGLGGRIPGELQAREVILRDVTGEPWIILDDVRIELPLLGLITNHVDIRRLTASRVRWLRMPASEGGESTLRLDIAGLDLPRVETQAEISSVPMVFSANGAVHLQSSGTAADIAIQRRDGPGAYRVDGAIRDGVASGFIDIDEAEGGLAAGLLGLTSIGPISANLRADGPADRNRIAFTINAGALHAEGDGTLDLPGEMIQFDFTAHAPAMEVREDISWRSFSAEGHAEGPFDTLALDSRIAIEGFRWNGVSGDNLGGTATGRAGIVEIAAEASALAIEGTDPKLFASAPVMLRGRAELGAEGRPMTFTLTHPLANANGKMRLADLDRITADIAITRLQPFAAAAGIELDGRANFAADIGFADSKVTIVLDGDIAARRSGETLANLIGSGAPFRISADVTGKTITNIAARLDGAVVDLQTGGAIRDGVLDLTLSARVADMSKVASALRGDAAIRATARGPAATARLNAAITGTIGTDSLAPQAVRLTLEGSGTNKPTGTFQAETEYRDAALALSGTFAYEKNELRLAIEDGKWKSVSLTGDVNIPRTDPVTADATVRVADLGDLSWITGSSATGSLEGSVRLVGRRGDTVAVLDATARNLAIEDVRLTTLTASGEIVDPFATQRLALKLTATDVAANGYSGTVTADVRGVLDAPAIDIRVGLKDGAGRPLKIEAAAVPRSGFKEIALSALAIDYRDVKASLMRPATINLDNETSVDALALRSGDARLTLTGRLWPSLSAGITLQGLTASHLRPFWPELEQASFSGSAQLTGTPNAPHGTVSVQGENLRIRGVPTGKESGTMNARADLMGSTMKVDAAIAFGSSMLKITGDAPLAAGAPMNLSAAGTADLSFFNAVLSAEGRRVLGTASLDIAIKGTSSAPVITGNVKIASGEFQDYPRGLRLGDIAASVDFRGGGIGIIDFTARAGSGTITGNGSVDFSASGRPVAISIMARNAEPAVSDTFRGVIDADLDVTGELAEQLTAKGKVTIRRAESRLPNSFPPEVASLNVVRAGQQVNIPARGPGMGGIAFDLDIVSPGQFFVRGRGIDAELEGDIHLGGTSASPEVTGAFTMRRGTFDLGGALLTFSTGKVTFDDDSLRERFDPALDFTAQRSSGGYTMRLTVSGTVSKPSVRLSSTPPLPQDEILAQLLYQQNVRQLTALQLAGMAQAAAALGGFGGGGFDPLTVVRRTLGLDRLSVVSGPGNQSQLEAGRYISSGIYVGARQGLSTATQAEVQVDITENLKAKATVATGTNANTAQGVQRQVPSSTVGLSWQFEY